MSITSNDAKQQTCPYSVNQHAGKYPWKLFLN